MTGNERHAPTRTSASTPRDVAVEGFMGLFTEATVRVIYGDTDKMGVVYYANYLRYFELSRSELFRSLGGSYTRMEAEGFGLPVVEAHCEYKASARYDDLLRIRVEVAQVKRASMRFTYELRRDGDERVIALGHTVHACVGNDGKPAGLPPWVVQLLAPT